MLLTSIIALALTPQVAQVEAALQTRIEGSGGSPDAFFGHVADLAVDGRGNAYILDDRANRVLVFSASGDYLRNFGRSGRGPGELNRPMRLDVRGDVVTVLNPSGQASSFTLTGETVPTISLPFGIQAATRIDAERYVVLASAIVARDDPAPTETFWLVGPEGAAPVLTVPSSDILFRGPTSTGALRTSLCRQAYFVVGEDDALWVASGIDGTLTEWRVARGVAEPRRSLALAAEAVPLPDSTLSRLRAGLPRQFTPDAGDLSMPSLLSSICGLERATDGTLWVRRSDVAGPERWSAVDTATLRPTRELTAPDGVQMSAFSGEMAYGIWVDEAGTPNVMMYRIE